MPLRLIFMGTPDFSVPTLHALAEHGHHILAAYTRPAKAADRGMKPRPSPVEIEARKRGIPVLTPPSLKTSDALEQFRDFRADAAVVVAYGLILPKEILDAPTYGCFNLHGSLLPRWRGAAPIERAIIEEDDVTGVMVMKMDVGLDTGDVLLAEQTPLTDSMTAGDLRKSLAVMGANLMVSAMDEVEHHRFRFAKQDESYKSYAAKIDKSSARIDWNMPARRVLRHIHGYSPSPGAWCEIPIGGQNTRVKILRCALAPGEGMPGELLDERLTIACGQGALRIIELQRAGKGPMSAQTFQAGARLRPPLLLH